LQGPNILAKIVQQLQFRFIVLNYAFIIRNLISDILWLEYSRTFTKTCEFFKKLNLFAHCVLDYFCRRSAQF
jgi:hypothetical protein